MKKKSIAKKRLRALLTIVLALYLVFSNLTLALAGGNNQGKDKDKNKVSCNLNHIDVCVYGSINVITKLNGTVKDTVKTSVQIKDLQATVTDNDTTKTYNSGWSTRTQTWQGAYAGKQEWHKNVTTNFSKNAVIVISGKMYSAETNQTIDFTLEFKGEEIEKANEQCPDHLGCDFILTQEKVEEIFTHTVKFLFVEDDEIKDTVVYDNLSDGIEFPSIPNYDASNGYVYWRMLVNGYFIPFLPEHVDKDYTVVVEYQKVQTEPSVGPSEEPSVGPSEEPSVGPSEEPSVGPSEEPSVGPTEEPLVGPTPIDVIDPPTINPTPIDVIAPPMESPTPIDIIDPPMGELSPTPTDITDQPTENQTPIVIEEGTDKETLDSVPKTGDETNVNDGYYEKANPKEVNPQEENDATTGKLFSNILSLVVYLLVVVAFTLLLVFLIKIISEYFEKNNEKKE